MSDYAWLPQATVLRWLVLEAEDTAAAVVNDCRIAAAAWCEQQRPDLLTVVDDVETFTASPTIVQAGVLATARLYSRKGSPAGATAYAELGPGDLLGLDPDVSRLLGTGRYARPAVG